MIERLKGMTGDIDTSVISLLLERGYCDLGQADPVSTYPTMISREKARPQVRLDYIFATEEVAQLCHNFHVCDDAAFQRASDHLPVVADIDI